MAVVLWLPVYITIVTGALDILCPTTHNFAFTPRQNNFQSFFRSFCSSGLLDFDQFYEHITTSEVVLLLGQKKLGTHVVVVCWVVNNMCFSKWLLFVH